MQADWHYSRRTACRQVSGEVMLKAPSYLFGDKLLLRQRVLGEPGVGVGASSF